MTYWVICIPLYFMGVGMPIYYVPLTELAMGSVNEEESASVAGLMNFVCTISGAFATSLVTTSWQNRSIIAHAELANVVDPSGQAAAVIGSERAGRARDAEQSGHQPKPAAGDQRPHDRDRDHPHYCLRLDRPVTPSDSNGRCRFGWALSPALRMDAFKDADAVSTVRTDSGRYLPRPLRRNP